MIAALRLLLLPAYLVLAHFAGSRQSPQLAVLALAALALLVLSGPLLHRRRWAWPALIVTALLLAVLARSAYALLPLLLVPVLFVALIAYWFARSLRPERVPLITRAISALYAADSLSPRHREYGRRLTLAWALLLGGIALIDLTLALIAVPDGLLAAFGARAPVQVSHAQWSLFANFANYGLIGLFLLIEFQWRKRVFPERPYRNFAEFVRRMAALGPAFWRDLLR